MAESFLSTTQAFGRNVPTDNQIGGSSGDNPMQQPKWMVMIDDYTYSEVKGFEEYSTLKGFSSRTSRGTSIAGSESIISSSVLRHSSLVLYVQRGTLQTKLENHLYKSLPIEKITIINLSVIKEDLAVTQKIEYENCYVQQLEPQLDWLLVELKITKHSNTIFKYSTAVVCLLGAS